jgi:hypothetical protein
MNTGYDIEILEIGIWLPIYYTYSWEDALSIASMYENKHGEDLVQIKSGIKTNEP